MVWNLASMQDDSLLLAFCTRLVASTLTAFEGLQYVGIVEGRGFRAWGSRVYSILGLELTA